MYCCNHQLVSANAENNLTFEKFVERSFILHVNFVLPQRSRTRRSVTAKSWTQLSFCIIASETQGDFGDFQMNWAETRNRKEALSSYK